MLNLHLAAVNKNSPYAVQRSVNATEGGHNQTEKNIHFRETAEALGEAKSTIWYITKNKMHWH